MTKKVIMFHEGREVRVIAEGEGWSMVRRKGAMPFVVRSRELRQPTTRADRCPDCKHSLKWCNCPDKVGKRTARC